jgi:hypothetical protein
MAQDDVCLSRRFMLSVCVLSFSVTLMIAGVALSAHERATCCNDPCTTSTGGVSCGCNFICDVQFSNCVHYYTGDCSPVDGGGNNCFRCNCTFKDSNEPKGSCDFFCCGDDSAECG